TTPSTQKKGKERLVGLERIALRTCEHEVVPAVVRRLPLSRCHVIHGDRLGGDSALAIRAYGTVLIEQPLTRFHVRVAAGRERSVLVCRSTPRALTRLA